MEILGSFVDFIKSFLIKSCLNYDISMKFCQDFCETRNLQGVTEQITRQSWSEVPGKILEQHDGDQYLEQCVCEHD